MTKNKQLAINMSASFIAYIVSFGISFFLSPYIVKNVGVDAYGFVGLANNFVSYASLITIALNALAGRFVTIKIYEKDMHGANIYFSSVFIANLLISVVMGIIGLGVVIFLEKLINLPSNLYWDVKLLFACLFLNCLIGTVGSVFAISTFATNKLYINSIRQIESNILRVFILVPAFILLKPRVAYLGISALVMGVYVFAFNIYYTKKLLPEIHIRRKYFDIKAIIKLISSGVWNLIVRVGQILSDGLDIIICNIFINPTSMGIMSLSKTVPGIITGIVGSIVGVFSPNMTILYAEKKYNELYDIIKQSMKIMGIITNIPVIVLIVCGKLFFELWQPTQDAKMLQILSVLTIGCVIFSGGINVLYDLFTVVNKLKMNAVIVLISGAIQIIITFILLKTTSLGIYAVAGVSTIVSIVRNLVFTVPYGAICLNKKWYTFYPDVVRPVTLVGVSSLLGILVNRMFEFSGWIGLILFVIIIVSITCTIGAFVILNHNDRVYIINTLIDRRKK